MKKRAIAFHNKKMLFMDYSILFDRPFIETLPNHLRFIKDGYRSVMMDVVGDQSEEAKKELILRN